MGAWPEAAGLEKELKAYRAYATFFGEAPVVVAVFSQTYHSLADELHERRGLPRDERDRLRQRPDIQSSARPSSCSAPRRTPWDTAPAG